MPVLLRCYLKVRIGPSTKLGGLMGTIKPSKLVWVIDLLVR